MLISHTPTKCHHKHDVNLMSHKSNLPRNLHAILYCDCNEIMPKRYEYGENRPILEFQELSDNEDRDENEEVEIEAGETLSGREIVPVPEEVFLHMDESKSCCFKL